MIIKLNNCLFKTKLHFLLNAGLQVMRQQSRILKAKVWLLARFGLGVFAEKNVVFAEMTSSLPRNPTLFAVNLTKTTI